MCKLSVAYILLPLVLLSVFANVFILSNVPDESILYEIVVSIVLLSLYFFGVYVTYRHLKWRKENMAHLLPGYEPPSEDKPE